mgnify:CR=1 FL=1
MYASDGSPARVIIMLADGTLCRVVTTRDLPLLQLLVWIAVVVSARGNATDELEEILEKASNKEPYENEFEAFKNYQKEALTILSEFPDSDAKNSLELLVDYVINRKK